MYLRYFGFDSYPFAVTPDPAFLYLGESHREALGHLLYGTGEQGGFVALIGEVGTGKTTLIRTMVENDTPDLDIALCWNPHLGVTEFVGTVCDELGVAYDAKHDTTLKALVDRLNTHLLEAHAANRRTVLIIDEAQNLSRDVLEQLRLLTNLETHKDKLLRVILVGQPELEELLARHDLRQLAQRITARFKLRPLGLAETHAYIQHRLERAGGPQHLFSRSAVIVLRALTQGVPRLINMVCERALMGAYAHGRSHVGPWTVLRAAFETLPARPRRRARTGWWRVALPTGLLAVSVVVLGLAWLPDIQLTSAAEWMHGADQAGHSEPTAKNNGSQNKAANEDHEPTQLAANDPPDGKPKKQKPDNAKSADSAPNASGNADAPSADDSSGQSAEHDDAAYKNKKEADDESSKNAPTNQALPKGDADMNQLLRLWGVFGAQIRSGCSQLHVGDLRCLADTGDFATLKRYNRPALLVVEQNHERQTVLLNGINEDKATVTLVGGDGTRDVDEKRLRDLWTGQFRVIWRSDAGVRLIRPGSVGSAVVWLRRRLMQIDGKNPDQQVGKPSPVYDDALGRRLKAFQKSHGLDADGIAGPRTQMMLNGAVPSPGSPALIVRKSPKQK